MVLLSKLCCKVQAIADIIIGFLGRKRNIVRNVSVFREGRGGEWCLGAFHMKRWHYVLFRDFSQKTIEVFKTCWSLLYSAVDQTHCARMWFFEWLAFYSAFLNSANVVYLQRCSWNLSNGRIQSSKHGDLFFFICDTRLRFPRSTPFLAHSLRAVSTVFRGYDGKTAV